MAKPVAKGIYKNAQVVIGKDGSLQAVTAGRNTPSQINSAVTPIVSPALATPYQNNTTATVLICGWVNISPGSSTAALVAKIGPANPPTQKIWGNEFTATVNNTDGGFQFFVPPGYWFELTATGAINAIGGMFQMALTLA